MGTRRQQQMRILKTLEENGWRRDAVEHEPEDWADEIWTLGTVGSRRGVAAWMAFVVDHEWRGKRAPGESVCALVADTVRRKERTGWLVEIPLGRRWERGLPELVDALNAARAALTPAAPAENRPRPVQKPQPVVKTRWKHLR